MRSSAASFHARYGNSLRQFGKFGMVGGMGVLVNMAVAFVLNKLHGGTRYAQQVIWSIPGTPYNIRFTVLVWIGAFLVANLVNFLLNRHWTFKGARAPFWRANNEWIPAPQPTSSMVRGRPTSAIKAGLISVLGS